MVPVIALVGRLNVGKSTSLKRLTRTRMRWLRISRVTRDRKTVVRKLKAGVICIHTGGSMAQKTV
ncbi:GTPase [Escherichia coli]